MSVSRIAKIGLWITVGNLILALLSFAKEMFEFNKDNPTDV